MNERIDCFVVVNVVVLVLVLLFCQLSPSLHFSSSYDVTGSVGETTTTTSSQSFATTTSTFFFSAFSLIFKRIGNTSHCRYCFAISFLLSIIPFHSRDEFYCLSSLSVFSLWKLLFLLFLLYYRCYNFPIAPSLPLSPLSLLSLLKYYQYIHSTQYDGLSNQNIPSKN